MFAKILAFLHIFLLSKRLRMIPFHTQKTRNLAMMYPTRMVVHYIARAGKSTSLNGGLDVNWPLGRGEFPICRCLLIPEWQLLFSDICSTSKLHHSRITTGTFQTFESHHNMIQDRCIGIGGWDSFHHVLCLTRHSGDGQKCHVYLYIYMICVYVVYDIWWWI